MLSLSVLWASSRVSLPVGCSWDFALRAALEFDAHVKKTSSCRPAGRIRVLIRNFEAYDIWQMGATLFARSLLTLLEECN